jgi:hypothetical protein
MAVKRIVGVSNPLFHGTTGPKVASIVLRKEGLRASPGAHGSNAVQAGISLTRSLETALGFGSYALVIDREKLRGKLKPVQYGGKGWSDEMEERFFGEVPVSAFKGVVVNHEVTGIERREWKGVAVPLIQRVGSKYEKVN